MNCDACLERVSGLLDGSLARSDREAVLEHLHACAECRDLHAALAAADLAHDDPDLSAAILARTSGAACASARSRLCARLDGELPTVEVDLVDGHLHGCPDCASLARALERVRDDLPLLATADPGPRFVEQVLARTSRRPRREPLGSRLAAAVSRWLERPRIAWEGAFVATALVVMPALVPGSPLSALPSRTLGVARELSPLQRRAIGELRASVSDLQATLASRADAVWDDSGAALAEQSFAVTSRLPRMLEDGWESIRERLGTFSEPPASGQQDGTDGAKDGTPEAAQEKTR